MSVTSVSSQNKLELLLTDIALTSEQAVSTLSLVQLQSKQRRCFSQGDVLLFLRPNYHKEI